jgi:pseudouridylate synthase
VKDRIRVAEPVAEALAKGRPVVALETAVFTHGLPAAEGMKAAAELDNEIRVGGAVTATLGVLGGYVHVGMSATELERLANSRPVAKVNPSNLGAEVAAGGNAGTTVAAALAIAAHAGIRTLVTGGIGGVHRNVAETGDVSADLAALGRCPVLVVCAGAKAVLDLPRTVEMLESLGVPVLGFAADQFPAFYRRESGLRVDRRCETAEDVARAAAAHWALGLQSGVVVANPIPRDHEMPKGLYDAALAKSLAEVDKRGLRGREVTPFLLTRMRELTDGRSVFSNLALLRHNARRATAVAVALASLRD